MEIPGLSSQAFKPTYVGNRNRYNGKELQSLEFTDSTSLNWDDYGARMYDPQIGRWNIIDPLSERSRRWSTFAYVIDNPMRFIDPDGMNIQDGIGSHLMEEYHNGDNEDAKITFRSSQPVDLAGDPSHTDPSLAGDAGNNSGDPTQKEIDQCTSCKLAPVTVSAKLKHHQSPLPPWYFMNSGNSKNNKISAPAQSGWGIYEPQISASINAETGFAGELNLLIGGHYSKGGFTFFGSEK